MTEASIFENSHLFWPVLVIAILLLALFVWKEWKRQIARVFYISVLIALITVASLAMLALKPLNNTSNKAKIGVLLTEKFSQERLDSIKSLDKEIVMITYRPNKVLSEALDSLSSIYILGDGVAAYDFWQFDKRSVRFFGADKPKGITRLKYNQENVLGEDLVIQGSYHKAEEKFWLVLQDGNGLGIDSVALIANDAQNFKLKTPLKAVGKFVFEIVEKDSLGASVSSDPLPFRVNSNKSIKILLVNGFPTFESKYLKNYLAESGHEVIVRSQLTKGRYKFEYFNSPKVPIYNFNQKALASFDLVIIDAISFKNISKRSRSSIENAIENDGLGVFIQPEPVLFTRASKQLVVKFKKDGRTKINLEQFPKITFDKFPYAFLKNDGLEKIHHSKSEIFTGYRRMQKGRVGATVFQNTYQLQLHGKSKAYRQFWSEIVSKLTKKNDEIVSWHSVANFPLEQQPYIFDLQTDAVSPQVHNQDGQAIALEQNIDIPTLWSGITYPIRQKWNQLQLGDEGEMGLDFYVIDSLSWLSLRVNNLRKKNNRYFKNSSENTTANTSLKQMSLLWFFVIGILGLAYLWLHPKLWKE